MEPRPPFPIATGGEHLARSREVLRRVCARDPDARLHYWLAGDSWSARRYVPETLLADLIGRGARLAASGWIGVNVARGPGVAPIGGTALRMAGDGWTFESASKGSADGDFAPDGHRLRFVGGGEDGVALRWLGSRLTLWFAPDGARLEHVTDGAAPVRWIADSDGPVAALAIDAPPGWHETVVRRPGGDAALWYGAFAGSTAPGLTLSKAGCGGATLAHLARAVATPAARAILAAIAPPTVRLMALTNDSRKRARPADARRSLAAIVAAFRDAAPACEMLVAVPPQNPAARVDVADYLPTVLDRAAAARLAVANHRDAWPLPADCPQRWADGFHLAPDGGGAEALVALEHERLWASG